MENVGYSHVFPFSNICDCNRSVFDLTFSKLLFAVLLGDFHLEYLVLADEGGHLRQALSPRAPNTNKQHVAPELTDHTYYTGYCGGNTKMLSFIYKYIQQILKYFVIISAYAIITVLFCI